ncbi:MAG: hypothetical protein ACRBBT_13105 [Paracoccaceae bacterium]
MITQIASAIFTAAPLWAWPLLVVLVLLGLRASRTRSSHVALVYALPLLGILSVRTVSELPHQNVIWLFFLAAYLLGAALGHARQRHYLIARAGQRLTLRGEWLTMSAMLLIFLANFVQGFMAAVVPDVAGSLGFAGGMAVLLGLFSGLFGGRALYVFRRAPSAALPA